MNWSPIPRYRLVPITVVTLDCGHLRYVSGVENFIGVEAVEASCKQGCPGMRFATGTGVIP